MTLSQILSDARDAWLGMRRRQLRSLLSGIGIGIGVMAMIAALSISEGARREALAKIASLGIDTIRVENKLADTLAGDRSRVNLSIGLTARDTEIAAARLGVGAKVSGYSRADSIAVQSGGRRVVATALGTDQWWMWNEKIRLAWGHWFTAHDVSSGESVCLLGSRVASQLHISRAAATVQVMGQSCRVIGVLRAKGRLLTEGTGLTSVDFDQLVVLPQSAFPGLRRDTAEILMDGIVVRLVSNDDVLILNAVKKLETILARGHRGILDYNVVVPRKLLVERKRTQSIFSLVMGSIAALSLLVGGIGVMNVMLANIAEQTREVGLRIALGAQPPRIISLYLWHAVLISLMGSVWGACAGVFLAIAVQHYAGWSVAFSLVSLLLGPVSAVAAGLLFGLYPAVRASDLQPAFALRDA